MERKREDGLEWLAEWVPEPAYSAFKVIAKAARKGRCPPGAPHLAEAEALAAVRQEGLPDWARGSDILLSVWMASIVAEATLDQIQAGREASRSKKSEAKAAGAAPEAADVGDAGTEPERTKAALAKRARKKRAAAPSDANPNQEEM